MVQRSDWRSKKEKIKLLDKTLNKGISSRRSGGPTSPIASLEGIVYLLDQPPGEEITLANINSLTAWYIADDSYITTEAPGDKVTYWQDVSGQGNDLEVVASGGVSSNNEGNYGVFYNAGASGRFSGKSYVLFNDAEMKTTGSYSFKDGVSGSNLTLLVYCEISSQEEDDDDFIIAMYEGFEGGDENFNIHMGIQWGGFEGNDFIEYSDNSNPARFYPLTGAQYFEKDALFIASLSSSLTGTHSYYNGFPAPRNILDPKYFTTRSVFSLGGIAVGSISAYRIREAAVFNSTLSDNDLSIVYNYFLDKYSDDFSTGSTPEVSEFSGTLIARYKSEDVLVDGGVVVALSDSSGLNNHLDVTFGTVLTESARNIGAGNIFLYPSEDVPSVSFSASYIENSSDLSLPEGVNETSDFSFYILATPRQEIKGGTGSNMLAEIFVSGSPTEPILGMDHYNDVTNDVEWGVRAEPANETSPPNETQYIMYFGSVEQFGTGSTTKLWVNGDTGDDDGKMFKTVYLHTGSKVRLGTTSSVLNYNSSASFLEAGIISGAMTQEQRSQIVYALAIKYGLNSGLITRE